LPKAYRRHRHVLVARAAAITVGGGKAWRWTVYCSKAKERGVVLGDSEIGAKLKAKAEARDAALRATLVPMAGMPSRAIAEQLNGQGIAAPRGGAWEHKSVLRMMARLGLKTPR
jgi:Recombinase